MPDINTHMVFGVILALLIGLFIPLAKDMLDTKRELRDVRSKWFDTKETLHLVRIERDESLAREERLSHIKDNTVAVNANVIGWLPPGLNDYEKAHRISTWEEMAKRKLGLDLSESVFIETRVDETADTGQVNVTAHALAVRKPSALPQTESTKEDSDA